jgi:hypothetical protein
LVVVVVVVVVMVVVGERALLRFHVEVWMWGVKGVSWDGARTQRLLFSLQTKLVFIFPRQKKHLQATPRHTIPKAKPDTRKEKKRKKKKKKKKKNQCIAICLIGFSTSKKAIEGDSGDGRFSRGSLL